MKKNVLEINDRPIDKKVNFKVFPSKVIYKLFSWHLYVISENNIEPEL